MKLQNLLVILVSVVFENNFRLGANNEARDNISRHAATV